MKNLCLVTSVINIPNLPYSYTNTRSVFNPEERFEQSKKTILTLKEKIPNLEIIFVECSDLDNSYKRWIENEVNYFLNIYDDIKLRERVFSKSRSLGEGTIVTQGLKFIIENNIEFTNLFKISGRYYLNNNFDFNKFNNDKINYQNNNTRFYKITQKEINSFLQYWISCEENFYRYEANEELFNKFLKKYDNKIIIDIFGVEGNIAIDNYKIVE